MNTHAHTHAWTHTCTHTWTHKSTHTHTCTHAHTHTFTKIRWASPSDCSHHGVQPPTSVTLQSPSDVGPNSQICMTERYGSCESSWPNTNLPQTYIPLMHVWYKHDLHHYASDFTSVVLIRTLLTALSTSDITILVLLRTLPGTKMVPLNWIHLKIISAAALCIILLAKNFKNWISSTRLDLLYYVWVYCSTSIGVTRPLLGPLLLCTVDHNTPMVLKRVMLLLFIE